MNSNNVHSKRTVLPVSRVSKDRKEDDDHHVGGGRGSDFPVTKLPPPPFLEEKSKDSDSKSSELDSKIPPPPCPNFQQHPLKSKSLRRSFRKNDDPFLAYIECTKSTSKDYHYYKRSSSQGSRKVGGLGLFGIKKNLSIFSCKNSSNVIESSIVRVSQLPSSKSKR